MIGKEYYHHLFFKLMILILCVLFFEQSAPASIRSQKKELYKFRRESTELSARLQSLEKKINLKKNLYNSSLQDIDQFSHDLQIYHEGLKKKQEEVHHSIEQNKMIIQSYLLDAEDEVEDLWQKKIHRKLIAQSQKKLFQSKQELDEIDKKVKSFEEKLMELKKNEQELSKVIEGLEKSFLVIEEKYQRKLAQKNKVEIELKKHKKKLMLKRIKKRVAGIRNNISPEKIFLNPIEQIISIKVSPRKGVTYKFMGHQSIKAVGGGKVVFAGDLASYGQVIMIDHGQELRTVLLGRMILKVKKNDSVKVGDEVALTKSKGSESQTLYFEVRKKNKAQKTVHWLDLKGVKVI